MLPALFYAQTTFYRIDLKTAPLDAPTGLWRNRRNALKLCTQLGTSAETCQAFVPDFSQPTSLECSVRMAGKPPVFRMVPAKEGMFEVTCLR